MASRKTIPERLRIQVRERAQGRCEYCLLPDDMVLLSHEADHIIAEQHGGLTEIENLAWSCFACNHYKGPNISSIDPETGKIVPLFHPRTQRWNRHFRLMGAIIQPLTGPGRATVRLLVFNAPIRVDERRAIIASHHDVIH